MKIRVKFRKHGIMKFIGHLDLMRYFQKAIKRADIDIAYTEGFSPHMIMSFASPLGVGITSDGEYMDIEINSGLSSEDCIRRLNSVMVEGMEVTSFKKIPDGKASNAMSLVAAADYEVRMRENHLPDLSGTPYANWLEAFDALLKQEKIEIIKKTKKSERAMDLKEFIFASEVLEDHVYLFLSAGSVNNVKPDLITEAFYNFLGLENDPFAALYHRIDMYYNIGTEEEPKYASLDAQGEDF